MRPHQGKFGLLAALLLSACSLAPTYERPVLAVVDAWPAAAGTTQQGVAAAGIEWENFFLDPQLKQLIRLALDNNRDLRVAALNIERARALYQVQAADRLPSLNAGIDGARQRLPADVSPTGKEGVFTHYSAGVAAPAFELDFFGRVRNLSDAALERYSATEEARASAHLSLVAEVAAAYETLQADQRLLELSRNTLQSRGESHARQLELHAQGASAAYDLRQSETLLASARAAVAQQTRQRALDENALTLLASRPLPAELLRARPKDAAQTLSEIQAGMPSMLLASRPDIRQREALLRAAHADIGAARAAFFPRIALTGSFGSASHELSGLFDTGSRAWSFLPQITLPIFDGGRNKARLGAANSDRGIALAQYEKSIQTAFREVADALAGRATLGEQLQAVRDQEAAEQARFLLSKERYDSGYSSYLELLDAQRALYAAQQAVIQVALQEVQNRIALYKALGGGWKGQAHG